VGGRRGRGSSSRAPEWEILSSNPSTSKEIKKVGQGEKERDKERKKRKEI
jgi:hypothetical protein